MNLESPTGSISAAWRLSLLAEIRRIEAEGEYLTDRVSLEVAQQVDALMSRHVQSVRPSHVIPKDSQPPCLLLSLDGGGLRGLIPIIVLERLWVLFPGLWERVKVVAGCSQGGMGATALAFGYSPRVCRGILELTARLLFTPGGYPMQRAKYRAEPLQVLCRLVWGTQTLADAEKPLVVPTFSLDNSKDDQRRAEPQVLHSLPPHPSNHVTAADAVLRTVAAPTYFPSHQNSVDGAMWANDPASGLRD